MDLDRYNTRVRQAISDKYVECSKKKQEISNQMILLRSKLSDYMTGNIVLTYKEYIDLKSSLNILHDEEDELDIEIAVWDEAREICLNIADEMCDR